MLDTVQDKIKTKYICAELELINNFLEVFQELCFDFEVEMLGVLHSFAE